MSNKELSEEVSNIIDQKLSETSKGSNYRIISKVDNILRMTNEAEYEPKMVSIGPYHRGKMNLQKMEKYKLECLQGILTRQHEPSASRYIDSLVQHEEEARSYYAEQVSLSREEFVEMMLLDGCFIVEFLRKYGKKDDDHQDPIFKLGWIVYIIRRDLLLFENQIPFFILVQLFDMTKIPEDDQDENLISLAIHYLNDSITIADLKPSPCVIVPYFHLLDLMYESWIYYSSAGGDDDDQNGSNSDRKKRPDFSRINLGKLGIKQQLVEEDPKDIMPIKSVSELKKDGIKFMKLEQTTSWLDIKFENGELRISPLTIEEFTECILRNLIAYELYMFDFGYSGKFVTDYAIFMDCLINNPMDVQELCVEGIVNNLLGRNKEITYMFNKISSNVFLSPPNFTYREVFKKVNKHCRSISWIRYLKKTYFMNPWSIISASGASIILILTLIQTLFSILQYFKKDP